MGVIPSRGLARFSPRRYRRMFVASVLTLAVSTLLLAIIGFTRWGEHRALQFDTRTSASQASEQLVRALNSRRATLTFIRDVLNRGEAMTQGQLKAMGSSAKDHTRHLLGIGLLHPRDEPQWWIGPDRMNASQQAELERLIARRLRLTNAWRVPSTLVSRPEGLSLLLAMLEPVHNSQGVLIGVFDLSPLLEDFFASRQAPHHPAQVSSEEAVLYRSRDWHPAASDRRPIIVKAPLAIDGERWQIQLQPGESRVAQTLTWFNLLLIALSAIAGLGITSIVWLVNARTWILRRAVQRRTAALRRTSERLRLLATTDELTGLYNRRYFLERWVWEYQRAKRYGRPLACLMVDVNRFKEVNDRLGHLIGDVVLKEVANALKAALRQSDILARFGGDEFIVALPETTADQAVAVAEKLRQVGIRAPGGGRGLLVSLSVGISQLDRNSGSAQEVIRAADRSMYDSKLPAWKEHAHRSA